MDLRTQSRIATPSCFICRWAGSHITVWPQEPLDSPQQVTEGFFGTTQMRSHKGVFDSYTSGRWKVFYKVEQLIRPSGGSGPLMRSKHEEIEACPNHWFALATNWQDVAQEEVNLDYIWNHWLERTEQ